MLAKAFRVECGLSFEIQFYRVDQYHQPVQQRLMLRMNRIGVRSSLVRNVIRPTKVYPNPRGEMFSPTCTSISPGIAPRKARIASFARSFWVSVASGLQRKPKM
jgi:hypothetical protein